MIAETNFNRISDGILREIFQSYSFVDEWDQLTALIVRTIANYHSAQEYDTLSEQVFFSVIGPHFREKLGFEEQFEPASFREPAMLKMEREYLQQSIRQQLVTEVTATVLSTREGNSGTRPLHKLQPLLAQLLDYYREKWKGNVFLLAEVVGSTLLRTMHRSEFQVVHDVLSPDSAPDLSTPVDNVKTSRLASRGTRRSPSLQEGAEKKEVADNDTLLNSYYCSQDSITQVYSLGLTSKDDYVKMFKRIAGMSDEITELLSTFSPVTMDSVCTRIVGSLLCNSMRVSVWSYRLLWHPSDRPIEPNRFAGELHRLGTFMETGTASKNTPISNTVRQYIMSCLSRAFPIWLKENTPVAANANAVVAGTVLARRAEHLVNATYVLSGIISERAVMVSIMLLRVFHDDSPVSEKMLRMYSKITEDYFPSDHPNGKYSLIYTNNLIWQIIKEEDVELFNHIKRYICEDPDDGEELLRPPSQEWNKSFGGVFKKARKEMPVGLALVKGWLETGFMGWLPEFGVIFIWDQLALLGATQTHNQRFVVRLCVQLLKLMREQLLSTTSKFVSTLRATGKRLRSKEVFNLTCEVLILHNDDIPDEEKAEFEEAKNKAAALSIQKACRGYLSRLRAKLIRRARDGTDPNNYLNSEGDFHSYQWMRRLSLQTDRSRAYQLQELQKFNASTMGRQTLRMANSRSECIIDVYGPADSAEFTKVPKDFLLPVLSLPSKGTKSSQNAANSASSENAEQRSIEIESVRDGEGTNSVMAAGVDINSDSAPGPLLDAAGTTDHVYEPATDVVEGNTNEAEKELVLDSALPLGNTLDDEFTAAEGVAGHGTDVADAAESEKNEAFEEIVSDTVVPPDNTIDSTAPGSAAAEGVSQSGSDSEALATTEVVTENVQSIAEEANGVVTGEVQHVAVASDIADSTGPESSIPPVCTPSMTIAASVASSTTAAGDAVGGREIPQASDPMDDILARSLIGAPIAAEKAVEGDEVITMSDDDDDNAEIFASAPIGSSSAAQQAFSGEGGDCSSNFTTALPLPKPSNFDPALDNTLCFPLEPALREEISKMSLSTISVPPELQREDYEIDQYALPHDEPLDYVSLGSLPRASVSPARLLVDNNKRAIETGDGDSAETDIAPVNPAPSLYGFFLEEREVIREEYSILESMSKKIVAKKAAFKETNNREMSHNERVDLVGALDIEFGEVKKRLDQLAVELRQKELRLLSKWSSGAPASVPKS